MGMGVLGVGGGGGGDKSIATGVLRSYVWASSLEELM